MRTMVPPGSRPKMDFSTAGFRRATICSVDEWSLGEEPGSVYVRNRTEFVPDSPTIPCTKHDLVKTPTTMRVVRQNRTRASNRCEQLNSGRLLLDCGLEMRLVEAKTKDAFRIGRRVRSSDSVRSGGKSKRTITLPGATPLLGDGVRTDQGLGTRWQRKNWVCLSGGPNIPTSAMVMEFPRPWFLLRSASVFLLLLLVWPVLPSRQPTL